MAEIPDVNPLKPIWPTRPDDRGSNPRRRDDGKDRGEREKSPPERKPDTDDGHQIDEYV